MLPGIRMLNVELDDGIVQFSGLGETNRAPMQPFEMRAEIQIVPFNVQRSLLTNVMLVSGQTLAIGLPVISVKDVDMAARELPLQGATTHSGTLVVDEGADLFALPAEA